MSLPPEPFPTRAQREVDAVTQPKKRSPRRAKLFTMLLAAVLGALLFDGVYLLLRRMTSREGPDVVAVLFSIPARLVRNVTGWNNPPPTIESGTVFDLAVNGLLGGLIFAVGAIICQAGRSTLAIADNESTAA